MEGKGDEAVETSDVTEGDEGKNRAGGSGVAGVWT